MIRRIRTISTRYLLPILFVALFLLSQDGGEVSAMWKYLFYYIGGFLVLLLLIQDLDRDFYGFVRVYLQVHVWKQHLDIKHKNTFIEYTHRIRNDEVIAANAESMTLWQKAKLKWEISLLKKIQSESGWYTIKYTGKKNNKQNAKIRKEGKTLVSPKKKGHRNYQEKKKVRG